MYRIECDNASLNRFIQDIDLIIGTHINMGAKRPTLPALRKGVSRIAKLSMTTIGRKGYWYLLLDDNDLYSLLSRSLGARGFSADMKQDLEETFLLDHRRQKC